jgi:hypothetical protein
VPVHADGHYRSPFANPKQEHAVAVKVGFLLSAVRNYDIEVGTFDADFYLQTQAVEGVAREVSVVPNALTAA